MQLAGLQATALEKTEFFSWGTSLGTSRHHGSAFWHLSKACRACRAPWMALARLLLRAVAQVRVLSYTDGTARSLFSSARTSCKDTHSGASTTRHEPIWAACIALDARRHRYASAQEPCEEALPQRSVRFAGIPT